MFSDSGFAQLEILHVVRQYAPSIGGLEEFVANLAAQQRNMFARVRVVTCDRVFTSPENKLPSSEVIEGIQVNRFPFFGSTRYPIMPQLLGAIRTADLVHVHAIDFAYDALVATKPFHRKPLVVTTHGGFFHTSAYKNIKKTWFKTLTRLSATGYKAIVCCSESDRRRFRKIAGNRVRLVMNGVDIEKFAGASSPASEKRAVTIGRFAKNKRLDRVLDMFAKVVSEDPEWKLDIFGVPYDISVDELDWLIEKHGLGNHVRVGIGLSVDEIRDALGETSYFLSASEYEGFGLALVEAMSAGLLPIVQPNDAYKSFATKHNNLVLCDFSVPEQAARHLLAYHKTTGMDYNSVRQNLMEAAQCYSWASTARAYADIYRDCLSSAELNIAS